MISQALAAVVPFAWFTADETCGQAKWLQAWLEDQDCARTRAVRPLPALLWLRLVGLPSPGR
jgi:hypothetical protein